MNTVDMNTWQNRAVDLARIMSQLKWEPVANGIPIRGRGEFKADTAYTGVPYSNGGWDGRMIGFDIYLKTFLAAVENPLSVLYTIDLRGQRSNSAAFYGTVCSGYTSYALQLAMQIGSSWYGPHHREGIEPAQPQSAQGTKIGDVLWSRGHVEIVTQVTTTPDGTATHVRVEDSWPPTTRTKDYTATAFDSYLTQRQATLYRITDHDAWRGENRAERFLFPNFTMDAETATINRILLLDLGDWVAYRKDHPVIFNIMDRDNHGVKALVIKREGKPVEHIPLDGRGIVERTFTRSGDYTAHCIMKDGTSSQACEFSVCTIDTIPVTAPIVLGQPWEIEFHAENMNAIHVLIAKEGDPDYSDPVAPYSIWLNDEHRRQGRVIVPADALSRAGKSSISVTGENRYGRLRNRHVIDVVKPK
ncbi:MAG: hypothetical protein PHQ41_08225 [Candidatus Cloacimonetes bacterium]|nr:hypothetical protein [Candidatus Cloacimonadota bacterium]